jgi:hypothetical protein
VLEPNAFEVEMTTENFKRHKLTGFNQIPVELIKAEGSRICFEIHKLILFGIKRNCLSSGRSQSFLPFKRGVIKTDCSNY